MGDEAEYLESIAWGEYATEEFEAEQYCNFIEDLAEGKFNLDRNTYISNEDLLYIANVRLKSGRYNSAFLEKARKIIWDENIATNLQRRCLLGFIRIEQDKIQNKNKVIKNKIQTKQVKDKKEQSKEIKIESKEKSEKNIIFREWLKQCEIGAKIYYKNEYSDILISECESKTKNSIFLESGVQIVKTINVACFFKDGKMLLYSESDEHTRHFMLDMIRNIVVKSNMLYNAPLENLQSLVATMNSLMTKESCCYDNDEYC